MARGEGPAPCRYRGAAAVGSEPSLRLKDRRPPFDKSTSEFSAATNSSTRAPWVAFSAGRKAAKRAHPRPKTGEQKHPGSLDFRYPNALRRSFLASAKRTHGGSRIRQYLLGSSRQGALTNREAAGCDAPSSHEIDYETKAPNQSSDEETRQGRHSSRHRRHFCRRGHARKPSSSCQATARPGIRTGQGHFGFASRSARTRRRELLKSETIDGPTFYRLVS